MYPWGYVYPRLGIADVYNRRNIFWTFRYLPDKALKNKLFIVCLGFVSFQTFQAQKLDTDSDTKKLSFKLGFYSETDTRYKNITLYLV